ncbi:hypothetical protein Slin15195_G094800 [Septoria linicola]|uniref:Uncharacterized protein n=1 Tax=Septoria linicola TaxID=215465 RepID=A0A9Q9ELV3_9PEZI|nr:hypothetical protein Slin15195_G094800 [Septoria linicola]
MLSFQLRRAQIELQAHRNWLKTFVVKSSHGEAQLSSVRNFSSIHRHGQEQERAKKEWNPIARARAKADAEQRRRQDRIAESAPEPGKKLSDAKRRKRERWEGRRSPPQTVELKALGVREDLMKAVQEYDVATVYRLYAQLPERRPLAAEDLRAIAQCAHQALRTENQKPRHQQHAEAKQEILALADLLAKDVRQGNVVPSRPAHTHLMGIYKESGYLGVGAKFWRWLEPQDDQHVGADTYAVAIELLAVHGTPLEDLEALYAKALARFPTNFSSYHLASNAIIPDRDAETKIKGLPISLLQAIVTARLLRGDSRQAYLALDTVFRLYPTAVDGRFIRLFLDERPMSEAYTVFAMACRAGLTLPTAVIKNLMARLRTTAEQDPSAQHRIVSLRAMLSVMHLYLGATGKALPNNVAELIIATTTLFRLPGIDRLEGKQRKKLVDAVLLSVRRMLESFARFGILPSTGAFNSVLMNIAGYGKSKETLGIVLKDFEALNLTPTDVTRRTVLAVAGLWKDQSMIEESWEKIVEARRAKNEWPEPTDFFVLSKAVKATGKADFAQKQFDTLQMFIPDSHHSSIEYAITKAYEPEDDTTTARTRLDFEELHEGVQKLNADLAVLESETRDKPAVLDFSDKQLPITLLPPEGALKASDETLRQVYDELTTEATAASSVVADSDPSA